MGIVGFLMEDMAKLTPNPGQNQSVVTYGTGAYQLRDRQSLSLCFRFQGYAAVY
jgi:hypothetical protein